MADTAGALGIKYIAGAHKPGRGKIEKNIGGKGIKPEKAVIIGDQLYTDVLSAVRLGAFSVLLTPISSREYIFTSLTGCVSAVRAGG